MSWRAQGLRTWLLQRLTAVYMLLYTVALLIYLFRNRPISYQSWTELFTFPSVTIATGVFFASLLYHAWVGVRDILVDYVHDTAVRFTLWVLVTLGLIGMGAWVMLILLTMVQV